MPKNTPVMRAPTTRERIMDAISSVGEAVGQQPLMRILGSLNRDLGGEAPPPMEMPDGTTAEWKIGTMPGGPGRGKLLNSLFPENKYAFRKGLTPNQADSNAAINYAREEYRRGGPSGRQFGIGNTPAETAGKIEVYKNREAMRANRGDEIRRNMLGEELAPDVQKMHPAVPPEFHAVEKARMPQSRTAPIDMENLPSGTIEYLDPDVAEYMNPKRILDFTTPEAQRRLRFLTGK